MFHRKVHKQHEYKLGLCVGLHILTFMLGSLLGNTEQTLQCWDFTDISKTSIYFCLELLSESVWALGLAER